MDQIGQNLTAEIEGDELILRIDLSIPGTVSASGKSSVIATTRGNIAIATPAGGQLKLGLNLYAPRGARP